MTNALERARRVRFAVWCMMDLPVTVGMEERYIQQPVMLVVAIPVMQFERLLTLDHLSADEAPPVLLSQNLGTKPRRRLQCQLAVTVLMPCWWRPQITPPSTHISREPSRM